MKSKQVANVLIKILGLSILVHGIPSIFTGILSALLSRPYGPPSPYWIYPMSSVILAGIGVVLMVQSRKLADVLFQGEAESPNRGDRAP